MARGSDGSTAHRQALAVLHMLRGQQAAFIAYEYVFTRMGVGTLRCLLLVLLCGPGPERPTAFPLPTDRPPGDTSADYKLWGEGREPPSSRSSLRITAGAQGLQGHIFAPIRTTSCQNTSLPGSSKRSVGPPISPSSTGYPPTQRIVPKASRDSSMAGQIRREGVFAYVRTHGDRPQPGRGQRHDPLIGVRTRVDALDTYCRPRTREGAPASAWDLRKVRQQAPGSVLIDRGVLRAFHRRQGPSPGPSPRTRSEACPPWPARSLSLGCGVGKPVTGHREVDRDASPLPSRSQHQPSSD